MINASNNFVHCGVGGHCNTLLLGDDCGINEINVSKGNDTWRHFGKSGIQKYVSSLVVSNSSMVYSSRLADDDDDDDDDNNDDNDYDTISLILFTFFSSFSSSFSSSFNNKQHFCCCIAIWTIIRKSDNAAAMAGCP
jgi:hypothetical protein